MHTQQYPADFADTLPLPLPSDSDRFESPEAAFVRWLDRNRPGWRAESALEHDLIKLNLQ